MGTKNYSENILETRPDGSCVVEYFENEGTPDEKYVIEKRNSDGICVKGYAYTDKTKSKLLETINQEIKPDGNKVKEIIQETANDDGTKYFLEEYDSNDNPVLSAAYTDKNKSKLIYKLEIINRKENGSHTVKTVYEKLQEYSWLSAIDDRDEHGRSVHSCYYSDNNFQNLYFVKDYEYRPDGARIEKTSNVGEDYGESQIEVFDKNNRIISKQNFYGKKFNDCYSTTEYIYFQDGSREEKILIFVENSPSLIIKYNSKEQPVLLKTYKDKNFEELVLICTQINNPDGSYIQRTVDRETKTSKIESYDASHRLICEQRYLDMDFKILDWTSKSSYNADGTSVDKTQYEKPEYGIQSKIVYFNLDDEWVSVLQYEDKDFKNLIGKKEREFHSDGSYTYRGSFEKPEEDGCHSEIKEYNSEGKYTSGKCYTDKNFSEVFGTSEKTYNPDGSSVIKFRYEKPQSGIWTKIVKLDADGNTISETESTEKDI